MLCHFIIGESSTAVQRSVILVYIEKKQKTTTYTSLLNHSVEPLVFVKVGPVQVIVVCKGMIAIQAQLSADFY
jgi:hypothetical protein